MGWGNNLEVCGTPKFNPLKTNKFTRNKTYGYASATFNTDSYEETHYILMCFFSHKGNEKVIWTVWRIRNMHHIGFSHIEYVCFCFIGDVASSFGIVF